MTRAFSATTGIIQLPEFPVHSIQIISSPYRIEFDVQLPTQVEVTKEECLDMLKTMIYMRRMEIENDPLYNTRRIKGFLHLYDGEVCLLLNTQHGLGGLWYRYCKGTQA